MVYDDYMTEEEDSNVNPNVTLQKDIDFIKNEIITQNPDGTYTKFCKALDAVSVVGMTKESYEDYWVKQYNKEPTRNKELGIILATVNDKFKNGLTDKEIMLDLIKNSNDCTKDKPDAIKLLLGVVK